jgi:hypothetical protein
MGRKADIKLSKKEKSELRSAHESTKDAIIRVVAMLQ